MNLEPEYVQGSHVPEIEEKETDNSMLEFAFHSRVAKEIKERDDWTCLCGEGQKQGLKVQASHKDHDRRNPYYNHLDNGTTLCVECHLREHIYLLETADEYWADWAWHSVRLLAQSVWNDSFHTKGYRHLNGCTIESDREKLVQLFEGYEMDVFDFIKL